MNVTPSSGDPVVYVTTDCTSLGSQCVAWAGQGGGGAAETVSFSGIAGTTYYVVVDAFTVTSVSFGIQIDGLTFKPGAPPATRRRRGCTLDVSTTRLTTGRLPGHCFTNETLRAAPRRMWKR